MPKSHRLQAPSYPVGVLPAVEEPPDPGPPSPPSPAAPAANASKADWVAYAEALGVDTTGMLKRQIREAVG